MEIPTAERRIELVGNVQVDRWVVVHVCNNGRKLRASPVAMKGVLSVLFANEGKMLSVRAIAERLDITHKTVSIAIESLIKMRAVEPTYHTPENVYSYTLRWDTIEKNQCATTLWSPKIRQRLSNTKKAVYCRAWYRANCQKKATPGVSLLLAKPSNNIGDEIRIVMETVCHAFGLDVSAMSSRSRIGSVVDAREFVVGIGRDLTAASYPDIAKAMRKQNQNHTTALSAHQRIRRHVAAFPDDDKTKLYRATLAEAERAVQAYRAGLNKDAA